MGKKRGKVLEELILEVLRNKVLSDPILIRSILEYDADNTFVNPRSIPDLQTVNGLIGSTVIVGQQFDEGDLVDPLSDGNWQLPFSPPVDNIPFAVRIDYDYTVSGNGTGYKNINPSVNNDVIYGFEDPSLGTMTIRVFSTNIIITPPTPAPLPVFTLQPAASATIVQTDDLQLVAAVTGATGYQWYKDGIALSGQTSDTLNIYNFSFGQGGTYKLRAYNADGDYVDSDNSVITYDAGRAVFNRSQLKSDFSPNGSGRPIVATDGIKTKTINAGATGYFSTAATAFDLKQGGVDTLTVNNAFGALGVMLGGNVSNVLNSPFFGPFYIYNDN